MALEKFNLDKLVETVKDAKSLEGIWVKKEKGEAIAKISTPRDHAESQALGNFNASVNLLGNGLFRIFEIQNHFATMLGKKPENNCHTGMELITDVFRSSASKTFGRGKATAETIKDMPVDISHNKDFPEPEYRDVKRDQGEHT